MRLLAYFIDPGEATAVNARLRAAGVLVRIGSADPHVYRPPRADAMRVGLWVVLDDQFADALRLLDDPDHVPRRVLSSREMDAIEKAADEDTRRPLRKWLDAAWVWFLGACLLGLILFTLIDYLLEA